MVHEPFGSRVFLAIVEGLGQWRGCMECCLLIVKGVFCVTDS